jgi:predicted ATPase
MSDGATGTVTFLFTDIEGSTERWQRDSRAMAEALAAHDELIRSAVERRGGTVFKHTGDGMCAVFPSAPEAVAAALDAQDGLELPVRMGLHTGEAESREGDFFGPTLNRAARVMDAGHGGQVLVSAATAGLLRDHELVDLGVHQLKGLDEPERIFQVGRGDFPALRTVRPKVGNLPVELSTFVGRADEVTSIVEELDDHRLVTLIGVGGTGKTRLAVETAMTVSEQFTDGCWIVELATVTVDDAVPFAFASGLGITAPPDGDVIDHVVARLRHKRCLVVVDNCEHVLASAADAVERIVAGCPALGVLATSREPLMVRGERLVPVPSLPLDDAVELFVQRARDEAPDLVIDDDQRRAVVELCRRLDGLPLALELAASRVRALTPVELVVNLEERFRMLVGGRRSRMERHQTMRGTLDWSYDLCGEVERAVFDRLSVFPAGFDLPGARAVAGGDGVAELDVVDVVPQLVDRSLLHRSTAPDGTTRYRMLETMRAYGREHLQHQGRSDAIRERHARYVSTTIAALTLRTLGPDEVQVARRIAEYLPDALAALDWFIDHQDWEGALRVTFGGQYVSQRELGEMGARLHDAARLGGAPGDLLDELDRNDSRGRLTESVEQAVERGWRTIRAKPPIPSDRLSVPPHLDFNDGGLLADDVDEFVASLEHWRSAPTVTRFFTEWMAIRALANNGHLEQAEQLLPGFSTFVIGLDSRQASRLLADLRGTLAMQREDWPAAAHWYGEVVAGTDGRLTTWFDLAAAWHHLGSRCLSPEPGAVTGADLRDPWICYRNEHVDVLRWHGAVATAIALRHLGRDDLAARFVGWAHADDPAGVMEMFRSRLDAVGLATAATTGSDEELDVLIDDVLAVADQLDNR